MSALSHLRPIDTRAPVAACPLCAESGQGPRHRAESALCRKPPCMRSHYEILGVSSDASLAEIQRAYCERLQDLHVRTNDDPDLTWRLTELNAAYKILGEQDKREAFDRDLLAAQPELRRGEIEAEGKPHGNIPDREFTEADGDKQMAQGRRSFDGTLEERDGGSARPVTKIGDQVHHRNWLILLLLIVLTGAIWLSFRGLGESARTVSRSEAECVTGTWRTRITFDDVRPELVSTTLRSRNRISSRDKNGCVDIAFACRSDGPYFEVRVEPQGPQIGKKGSIVVEGFGDELNASVSGWRSNDGRSITISDKAIVEVLGSLLIDRGSFAVRLGLLDGGDAVAHFDSANLHSAIRPVMLACGRPGQP
jgi:curved DNA-binding protein CbpA